MKSTEEVKKNILNTAANLFYKQGYNSTGINQIIEESEIARASLYNHFKSKSDLLHAYLEDASNKWFDELYKYIADTEDPKEKILKMFDFRMERQIVNQYRGCPFIKAGAEIAQNDSLSFEIVDRNKMTFRDFILAIITDMKTDNNNLSKIEIADTLYMLLEGATVTASFQKNGEMMQRAKQIAKKLLY